MVGSSGGRPTRSPLLFQDQTFDAVACQFGVMFFPDKVRGYGEARRVPKPDGRFFINVWDEISANEFADVVTEALGAVFPQDPPRFMARIPHGYHDVDKVRAELGAAGFASVAIETIDGVSRAASPRDVAVAYCQGTRCGMKSRRATHLVSKRRHWPRPGP
jgi:SAM-dependent methyltransferase